MAEISLQGNKLWCAI